jgi:rhamnose utilization protein RhaD (predicted bifunctional aldolase and dehydrogenase)
MGKVKMSHHVPKSPQELSQHAATIGADISYVQGPGGNVSVKQDGILWIKASGTQMSTALEHSIFVGLDVVEAARISMLDDSSKMMDAVLPGSTPGLRPSIETAMHAIIPARVVSHVHSVGAVAVGILADPTQAIEELSEIIPLARVPYVRPGAPLARAIQEVLEPHHKGLLLGNHGLTVWGDSFSETEVLIEQIEKAWRIGKSDIFPDALDDSVGKCEPFWVDALRGGTLVPDEAVLLGVQAFASLKKKSNEKIIFDENCIGRPAQILSDDARDIARMLISVGQHVDANAALTYLSDAEVAELLNWDMEKFRQEMSK